MTHFIATCRLLGKACGKNCKNIPNPSETYRQNNNNGSMPIRTTDYTRDVNVEESRDRTHNAPSPPIMNENSSNTPEMSVFFLENSRHFHVIPSHTRPLQHSGIYNTSTSSIENTEIYLPD